MDSKHKVGRPDGGGFFLLTFVPVCCGWSRTDLDPPFVDGSIRREPDFLSKFPSITALCRGGRFAPHRMPGDEVIYLTKKGRYSNDTSAGWRLVAHLKVIFKAQNHQEARDWYQSRGIALPSNCMVPGNRPLPLIRSHSPSENQKAWDAVYRQRSREHPEFLICKTLWMNLVDPPQLTKQELKRIFGRVPGTQSGCSITPEEYRGLLNYASGPSRRRAGWKGLAPRRRTPRCTYVC